MKPSNAQIYKLIKLVKTLYQNEIIDNHGYFTEKGKRLQRDFAGSVYNNLIIIPIRINTDDDSSLKEILKDGYIWLLINTHNNWGWVSNMNERFNLDEIINLNYEMYKMPYYNTELEHAAELLADDEFDDI